MPKKIAPKLISLDQSIYAVLSPGNGYLKELYGDVSFYDKLPRASGSFLTRDEALDAQTRAIARARIMVEEGKKRFGGEPNNYFENKARDIFKQAQDAIVVEITIRGVI